MLGDFLADLSSAVRSLRREPGFVLLAVLTLAVGVGSTATVFGMVNQLLLRPLPGVRDPEHAARVELQTVPHGRGGRRLPRRRPHRRHPDVASLLVSVEAAEAHIQTVVHNLAAVTRTTATSAR